MSWLAGPIPHVSVGALTRVGTGAIILVLVLFTLFPFWKPPTDLLMSVQRLDAVGADFDPERLGRARSAEVGQSVPLKFGATVHWLRATIARPENGEDVVLRFRPMALDRATIYMRDGQGRWMASETGELVHPNGRSWPQLTRHAVLVPNATQAQTIFVKLESQTPVTVFMSAVSVATAVQLETKTIAFHALVFSLKMVSLVTIVLTLPRQKSSTSLFFFALEFFFLFYLALHLGYAHALLHSIPVAWLDAASAAIVPVMVLSSTVFHRAFLLQFRPAALAQNFALLPILLSGTGLICVLGGIRLFGLALTAAAMITLVPVIIALLATMRGEAAPGRRLVRLIYSLYVPLLLANVATAMGFIRLDWFYRNGPEFLSLFSSTLLLALMILMNRSLNNEWMAQRGRIRQNILARRTEMKVRRAQHFLTHLVARETRGTLSELRRILLRDANRPRAEVLERAMAALEDVVEDCLRADAAETGEWRTDTTPFDAAALLRELSRDASASPGVLVTGPDQVMLVSDPGLFGVILRHLIQNATIYAEPGTPISASVGRRNQDRRTGAALSIANTVPVGIDVDPDRIFEKFFRGPQSSVSSGTGLGLYICREIALALGGTIHASVEGRVVTLHLWLPDR